MGVSVAFDYNSWIAQYPQWTAAPGKPAVEALIPIVELYLRNDGGGPVSRAQTQSTLLNLMVAHLVQLWYGVHGNDPQPIVGRISSATEGSVSVSLDLPTSEESAWFAQTPWGLAFWQATASYRTMRYIPGPRVMGWRGYPVRWRF